MPGPGGRDFLQAYNCQAVVDHEHQVIVAARATNQASDKQQAVVMITGRPSPMWPRCPGRYPPTPVTIRPRPLPIYRTWAPTLSSRRKRPATGYRPPPAPKGRIPKASLLPGTGCAASCRPSGAASVTRYAWPRWSRYSARSSRARGFRQFLLRGLAKVQGEWSLICTGHNLLKLFRYGKWAHRNGRQPLIPAVDHSATPHPLAAAA